MKPVTVTVSASAGGPSHSAIYVPDRHENPFNISIGADVATTAHFTILHTFQDPQRTVLLSNQDSSNPGFPPEYYPDRLLYQWGQYR